MYSSSIYTFGQPMRYVEVGMGRGWDAGSLGALQSSELHLLQACLCSFLAFEKQDST